MVSSALTLASFGVEGVTIWAVECILAHTATRFFIKDLVFSTNWAVWAVASAVVGVKVPWRIASEHLGALALARVDVEYLSSKEASGRNVGACAQTCVGVQELCGATLWVVGADTLACVYIKLLGTRALRSERTVTSACRPVEDVKPVGACG